MPNGDEYDDLIEAAGRRYNVDPRLIKSIMLQESRGNSRVRNSDAGAIGIMQLMPETARSLGVDPRVPAQAIDGAARLLARHLDTYGSPEMAVLAYHGGPDQRQWGPKTREYVQAVGQHYARLGGQGTPQGVAPIGQSGQTATSPVDPAALQNFVTGGGAGQPRAETRPGASGDVNADIEEFVRGAPEPAPSARAAGTRGERLQAGFTRGMRDVLDKPAEVLAAAADWTGIPEGIRRSQFGRFLETNPYLTVPIPTAEQLRTSNAVERSNFNRDYENSGYANVGRIAGQVAATVPVMMTGGNLLATAGNAAQIAVPGAARLAPFAQTAFGTAGATTGNPFGNAAARLLGGSVAGGASAALTLDPDRPAGPQLMQGAGIGAGFNALVAPAMGAAANSARSFFSHQVTPERAALATRAEQLGVPIYAPQLSTSPAVQRLNAFNRYIPFSGMLARDADQLSAFTRAVGRSFGEDTDAITLQTIAAARRRIGDVMGDVARNTELRPDPQVLQELMTIRQAAIDGLEETKAAPIVRYVNDLLGKMSSTNTGRISGDQYQTWTRNLSPLHLMEESNDSAVRLFGDRIRNSLDDLLERSSPAGELARLRDARAQWKAMMTVRPLVMQSPDGVLNPPALMRLVANSYGTFLNGTGTGNALGDLAQIGKTFFSRPFGSDTAPNSRLLDMIRNVEAYGPIALAAGDPTMGLIGAAASAATSGTARATSSALNSQWYRNRLMNSAANPPAPTTRNLPFTVGVPAAVATGNVLDETAYEMPPVVVTAPR